MSTELLDITDPYEREAWEAYLRWVDRGRELGLVGRGLRGLGNAAAGAGASLRDRLDGTAAGDLLERAGSTAQDVWSSDRVQQLVATTQDTVDEAYTTAIDASLRSVDPTEVLVHYRDHVQGERVEELRALPLRTLDRCRPALGSGTQLRFAATGAATGTVQGMTSVTGVLSAGAAAADIVASIGLSARAIAIQLAHYGYDVTRPAEHAYVLTLLQAALAESTVEQTLLTNQARSLAAGLAQGRSWSELNEQVLTRLARRGFRAVGERMTRQRLARLLPGVAGVIGAGQGYRHGGMVLDAAFHEGRARFLRERWGDPDAQVALNDWSDGAR